VDPLTHGLASFALQRGFFPGARWRAVFAIIIAGLIADIDRFSSSFGPAAYLRWHRSATHSIVFVLVLALATIVFKRLRRNNAVADSWSGLTWIAVVSASSLHILMDLLQTDALAPLWPFSTRLFSLDLAPSIDPWLLVILAATILFPELVHLVSDEIGSRNKRPRGRAGAITGLAFALLYFALRGLLHGNAVIALEARTVAGEMPRRVGAFPDAASPFLWHSIVETESALHLADMRSMGGEVSYASSVTKLRKPEASPMLSAAQASPAAAELLKTARFPKAVVQKETEGYSVEIHDLKDQATESRRAIFADVNLDTAAKVVSSELQWQKTSSRQ
jgi:inner membrane protein